MRGQLEVRQDDAGNQFGVLFSAGNRRVVPPTAWKAISPSQMV